MLITVNVEHEQSPLPTVTLGTGEDFHEIDGDQAPDEGIYVGLFKGDKLESIIPLPVAAHTVSLTRLETAVPQWVWKFFAFKELVGAGTIVDIVLSFLAEDDADQEARIRGWLALFRVYLALDSVENRLVPPSREAGRLLLLVVQTGLVPMQAALDRSRRTLEALLNSLDVGGEQSRAFAQEIAAIRKALTYIETVMPSAPVVPAA